MLLAVGVGSIWWWMARNDLRPYGWVQFFPILLVVLIAATEKPSYTSGRLVLVGVFSAYVAAKLLEAADKSVYRGLHEVLSGHALKHIAAAVAPALIAAWIATRREVGTELPAAPTTEVALTS